MKPENNKLLSLSEACKLTPYSQEYLGLLIRKNRIKGEKVSGKWYVNREAIDSYMSQVASANYERQESLNVKIPAQENKMTMLNLKWALLLAVVVIIVIATWSIAKSTPNDEYKIERDGHNNLIIHVDDPDAIGSVTVVPK
jgi:excisionase family DNA binding protein